RVPTVGLCPLTPSVADNVGTIWKRASSWLSRTNSPACAFFKPLQVFLGLLLLGRIATQVTVGGPVGANADLLAEAVHRRAGGLDAVGLQQVVGQLLVGPVGPVQAASRRPVDDPTADLVGHRVGDVGSLALSLFGEQALEAVFAVGVEPAGDAD